MEENENKIIIGGVEYEIISYVTIESGNYIVYTDGKKFDNGQIALYVNRVISENGEVVFDEVDDTEVMQVVDVIKERLNHNE